MHAGAYEIILKGNCDGIEYIIGNTFFYIKRILKSL